MGESQTHQDIHDQHMATDMGLIFYALCWWNFIATPLVKTSLTTFALGVIAGMLLLYIFEN